MTFSNSSVVKNVFISLLLVSSFVAADAFGVFTEPTTPATGGNVFAPLNTSNSPQIKVGKFAANKIITNGKLCFGPTACIGGWWDSTPNACHLEVKKVNSYGAAITTGGPSDTTCNYFLTPASKAAGWIAVGSDQCGTMWDRDCQRPSTCIYMRMKCTGVVVDIPTTSFTSGVENHPVPGFTQ